MARARLTYEGFFIVFSTQAVAAREESVSISLIKPRQIPEVEAQSHLQGQLLRRAAWGLRPQAGPNCSDPAGCLPQ